MKRAQRLYAALVAVGAFCLGLWALDGLHRPLATLTSRTGAAVDRRSGEGPWRAARPADGFEEGDRLRTGSASGATVTLRGGARLRMGPGSTLRFTTAPEHKDDAFAVHVETGLATVTAGARPARLYTQVGLAVLDAHTELTFGVAQGGLALDVAIGAVRFHDASGRVRELRASEHVAIGIGMAVLDGPSKTDELVRVRVEAPGVVARGSEGSARALDPGEHVLPRGAALRLEGEARVRVLTAGGDVELDAPGSYRLGARDGGVEAMIGRARIHARERDVRVAMPTGSIVARAVSGGSRAELVVSTGSFEVYVIEGEVRAELGSERLLLTGGERLKRPDPAALPVSSDELASLPYSHVRVRAGESATLHAAPLPLAVAISSAESCDTPLSLSVGRRLVVRGASPVSVLLTAGSHAYQLRCGTRTLAKGQLTLLADAGLKKLPPRAPSTDVDADGRSYTIHYQNQPPELRVRWPNAPPMGPYLLSVDGKPQSEARPSALLPTGSLGDGAHELVWSAGKRRSRPARVLLQYDRTAPAASLSAPLERSFGARDRVLVRGEALRAFQVELLDGTIDRDGQDRFTGVRVTSPTSPDIAVRLSHPRRGIHYYVRRSAESP